MKRVLVVEDNRDLAYGLRNNLEIEGYQVEVADDGPKGLMRARTTSPDLVILDLMLPGMDGYRVLRALREEGRQLPILILTARGEEADKVRGLRLGADDYVTKPFGVLELLARVEALMRRAGVDAEMTNAGCCGLAGSFGYHAGEQYEVSMRIGEQFLLPAVRAAEAETLLVADGFSCRTQITAGTRRRALHTAEVLALGLLPIA